jgi:hypothetical protein
MRSGSEDRSGFDKISYRNGPVCLLALFRTVERDLAPTALVQALIRERIFFSDTGRTASLFLHPFRFLAYSSLP